MISVSNKPLLNLFFNKACVFTFISILVDAIIAGSMTYVILELGQAASNIEDFHVYIPYFISILILSLVSNVSVNYFIILWGTVSVNKFGKQASSILYFRPDIVTDKSDEQKRSGELSGPAIEIIQGTINFISTFFRVALLALVNTVILSSYLSGSLLVVFLSSIIVSIIIILKFGPKLTKLGANLAKTRGAFGGVMGKTWSILTPGDQKIYKIWQRNYFVKVNRWMRAAVLNNFFTLKVQLLILLICYIPSVSLYLYLGYKADTALRITMLVGLPKLLQIINNSGQIVSMAAAFGSVIGQLKIIKGCITSSDKKSLSERVNIDDITINGETKRLDVERIIELLSKSQKQRITIRGKNGSGKTSLLLMLKEHLKDRAAIYLWNQGEIFSQFKNYSSGESRYLAIKKFIHNRDETFLLIDEWDTNLDAANRDRISALINDCAAEKHVVIEIRHSEKNNFA